MDKEEVQVKLRCGALVTPEEKEAVNEILRVLSDYNIPYYRCDDLLELSKDELEEYPIKAGGLDYDDTAEE